MRKTIATVGPNAPGCPADLYEFGLITGKWLADKGFAIINGGRGGWMEAICKGAHMSERYRHGATVCILPSSDPGEANPYCDIIIPTGLGLARNFMVANSAEVVLAAGGGAGTLSEIAYAWQLGKTIIAVTSFGGWAARLAGERLDYRRSDIIYGVKNFGELQELLTKIYQL